MLAAQDAMAADLADRVPVGEPGVRYVAHPAVGVLATGAAVAAAMPRAAPGLGSRLQYCDHDPIPSFPGQPQMAATR